MKDCIINFHNYEQTHEFRRRYTRETNVRRTLTFKYAESMKHIQLKTSEDTGYSRFLTETKRCLLSLGSVQARSKEIASNDEIYHEWKADHIRLHPGLTSLLTKGPLVQELNPRNGLYLSAY